MKKLFFHHNFVTCYDVKDFILQNILRLKKFFKGLQNVKLCVFKVVKMSKFLKNPQKKIWLPIKVTNNDFKNVKKIVYNKKHRNKLILMGAKYGKVIMRIIFG